MPDFESKLKDSCTNHETPAQVKTNQRNGLHLKIYGLILEDRGLLQTTVEAGTNALTATNKLLCEHNIKFEIVPDKNGIPYVAYIEGNAWVQFADQTGNSLPSIILPNGKEEWAGLHNLDINEDTVFKVRNDKGMSWDLPSPGKLRHMGGGGGCPATALEPETIELLATYTTLNFSYVDPITGERTGDVTLNDTWAFDYSNGLMPFHNFDSMGQMQWLDLQPNYKILSDSVPDYSQVNIQAHISDLVPRDMHFNDIVYNPGVYWLSSEQATPKSEAYIAADNQIISKNSSMAEMICLNPGIRQEESVIIRLLMNPAERKLWGKMYGLADEEEAHAAFSTKAEAIKYLENNRSDHKDNQRGMDMADNQVKIEKNEAGEQRLRFSLLLERPELQTAQEQLTDDDDKSEPDKFGMKIAIGDMPKEKRKKSKKNNDKKWAMDSKKLILAGNKGLKNNNSQGKKTMKDSRGSEEIKVSGKAIGRKGMAKGIVNPGPPAGTIRVKKGKKITENKKERKNDIVEKKKIPARGNKETEHIIFDDASPFTSFTMTAKAIRKDQVSNKKQNKRKINKGYALKWLMENKGMRLNKSRGSKK